jgi:hypothetical protein
VANTWLGNPGKPCCSDDCVQHCGPQGAPKTSPTLTSYGNGILQGATTGQDDVLFDVYGTLAMNWYGGRTEWWTSLPF